MKNEAIEVLDANRTMAIATIRPDGWPQTTIVGYANEGFSIYFVIFRASQKFANIAAEPRVRSPLAKSPMTCGRPRHCSPAPLRRKSSILPNAIMPGRCLSGGIPASPK